MSPPAAASLYGRQYTHASSPDMATAASNGSFPPQISMHCMVCGPAVRFVFASLISQPGTDNSRSLHAASHLLRYSFPLADLFGGPRMHLTMIKSDPRAREKPCLRCGLSLRKLLDAKHCPQCGLSVWLSLNQNDTMDWSNPAWLRAMSIGAAIMAPAQLLALAAYVFLVLPMPIALEKRYAYAALVGGAYLIVYSCGLLVLCRPERRYPDRLGGYRRFAQIAAVVGVVVGSALCAKAASTLPSGWPIHYPEIPATLPEGFDPE